MELAENWRYLSLGGWKTEGPWFKPRWGQNIGGVLVVREGSRTPSDHSWGAIQQGTKPTNAQMLRPHDGERAKAVYKVFQY